MASDGRRRRQTGLSLTRFTVTISIHTLIPAVYQALLKSAFSGIGHHIHPTKTKRPQHTDVHVRTSNRGVSKVASVGHDSTRHSGRQWPSVLYARGCKGMQHVQSGTCRS